MENYEIMVPYLENEQEYKDFINELAGICHIANKKWWLDPATGEPQDRSNPLLRGTKLMLVVSEVAEAMEGERKGAMDDKLPHRKMAEVELADAVIRIFDYAAALGYDLGGAFIEKMRFNVVRKDHTTAERLKPSGKKF